MRFASLGSGSRGNALVVEAGRTRVMLDCGFGVEECVLRLARIGLEPGCLNGIVVTHEHDDHARGVGRFARRHGIRVFLTHGTLAGAGKALGTLPHTTIIDSHTMFAIGDLELIPFPVPHDSREPVQFVFSDGQFRLCVLTDVGCSTAHIEVMLSGLDGLVLECNHDTDMLREGSYPAVVKSRIAGRFGHLSNDAAAALLSRLDVSRLQHLVAAHLSEQNNRPQSARSALAAVLGCSADWIAAADQENGFGWRALL